VGLEDITSSVNVDFGKFFSEADKVTSRISGILTSTESLAGAFSTLEDSAAMSMSRVSGVSVDTIQSLNKLERSSVALTASWQNMVTEGLTPLRNEISQFQTDVVNLQGGIGATPTLGTAVAARTQAALFALARSTGLDVLLPGGAASTGDIQLSAEQRQLAQQRRSALVSQAIIDRDRAAEGLFSDRERRDRNFQRIQSLDREQFERLTGEGARTRDAENVINRAFSGFVLTEGDRVRRSELLENVRLDARRREFDIREEFQGKRRDVFVQDKFNNSLQKLDETMLELIRELAATSDEDILRVQVVGDVR
jgi:hypothetical protein